VGCGGSFPYGPRVGHSSRGIGGGVRPKVSHRDARRQSRNDQGSVGVEPLDNRATIEGSAFNSVGGQRTAYHSNHNNNGGGWQCSDRLHEAVRAII